MIELNRNNIEILKENLSIPQKIAVIMHPNPDGDTIGASIAWSLILKKLGHNVMTISVDPLPYDMLWLPGVSDVVIFERKHALVNEFLSLAKTTFCIDFNTPKRLNNLEKAIRESKSTKVLIDHHLMPDAEFFDLMFSEINISSTSELLFILLKEMGYSSLIDKDIANNIFIGIMTDTGSFSYSCNSPETFENTAQLIRFGLNVKEVHDKIYNDNPEDRLRLMGFSINEKLIVKNEHFSSYISLTKEELKMFNEKPGFTEGLVNLALSVEGVQFAVMMTEKNDYIKFSFRSKGNFDVNMVAREFFNGGGHKNASGGKLYITMKEAISLVEKVMLEKVAPSFQKN